MCIDLFNFIKITWIIFLKISNNNYVALQHLHSIKHELIWSIYAKLTEGTNFNLIAKHIHFFVGGVDLLQSCSAGMGCFPTTSQLEPPGSIPPRLLPCHVLSASWCAWVYSVCGCIQNSWLSGIMTSKILNYT